MRNMLSQKGYSIVETLVVLAIFTIIMVITTSAFDSLISSGSHTMRSSAGQIEGIVGLEMLRRDLSHAGYGLFWEYKTTAPASAYEEVSQNPVDNTGVTATGFNEIVPHGLSVATAGAGSTNPGTDYLVIKSALLPLTKDNSSVGRWGYLDSALDASGNPTWKIRRANDPATDLRNGTVKDRVVTIAATIDSTGKQHKSLITSASGGYSYPVSNADFTADTQFMPTDASVSYVVYGIADKDLVMPYNRADYYVNRPAADSPFKVPASCNSGTGILFKSSANHEGGYNTYPLLNCVADMKVVYNTKSSGYYPAVSPTITAMTPGQLRSELKSVTVYVLVQDGKKDPSYTYPEDTIFVGPMEGSTKLVSAGKLWSKTELDDKFPDWKHYRWKVYSIFVNPRNMQE